MKEVHSTPLAGDGDKTALPELPLLTHPIYPSTWIDKRPDHMIYSALDMHGYALEYGRLCYEAGVAAERNERGDDERSIYLTPKERAELQQAHNAIYRGILDSI